jgi:hypothetical protein
MSVEPGLVALVEAAMVDWSGYLPCRICRAQSGKPCIARYTQIVDGEHTGPSVELPHAHGNRKRASGR